MPWYRIPFHLNERASGDAALAELASAGALADGLVCLNFGRARNKKAPPPCVCCGWISERECDWVVNPSIVTHGKRTCDAPLCDHCTTSPAPEKDICPKHVGLLKAWLAGRTNTVDGVGP